MLRYLVFSCALFLSSMAFTQSEYLSFSVGLQTYNQSENFGSITVAVTEITPTIIRTNTLTGGRAIFGIQWQKFLENNRLFRMGAYYANSTHTFNSVNVMRDNSSNIISASVSPILGSTTSHFSQIGADYGLPLLKKGEQWQFYLGGRLNVQHEFERQDPSISAGIPKNNWFLGTTTAIFSDLIYTFPNDKLLLSFTPVWQFFSVGYEVEQRENPTRSQTRTTGTSLELFGKQPLSFDLRVGFLL